MRRPLIAALVVVLLVARDSGQAPGSDSTFLPLAVPAQTGTVALGTKNLGQIGGESGCCAGASANDRFLLPGGTSTTINFPDPTLTQMFGITNAGFLAGKYGASGVDDGVLYPGGGFETIDVPGAIGATRRGINDAGQIAGTYGMTTAHGFDTRGDVAGTYERVTADPSNGFLVSGGSFTTINPPGPSNTGPFGINDAGARLGQTLPQGVLASTVPEPSTWILAGTALLGMGFRYWRRARRG